MCTHMIQVTNPTRKYVDGVTRPVLWVPCGECKECRKALQDEWFVRGFIEYKRVTELGGGVWFATLTYNSECLPTYNDEEYGLYINCFNHEHLRLFMRKLRTYLKRKGYPANDIRYFMSCELGSKRARPHYHVLLFVPFRVKAIDMQRCVQRAWIYGWSSWSKKGMMLKGTKGLQYGMKYVSKDIYYWTHPITCCRYDDDNEPHYFTTTIKEYGKQLRDLYNNLNSKDMLSTDIEKKYRDYQKSRPRHYSSTHFGEDGINYYRNPDGSWNLDKLSEGNIDLKKLGLTREKGSTLFPLPRYYARKIFYEQDTWNLYRRTPLAADVLRMRFNMLLQRTIDSLSYFISGRDVLLSYVRPYFDANSIPESIQNEIVNTYASYIQDCGLTPRDIAIYSVVYRGIPLGDRIFHFKDLERTHCVSELSDDCLEFMITCQMCDREPDDTSYVRFHPECKREPMYGDLPCYKGLDSLLDFMNSVNTYYGDCETKQYNRDEEARHNLSDINSHKNCVFYQSISF